jgi:hypothetical protein
VTREEYEWNLYRFKVRLFERESRAKRQRTDTLHSFGYDYFVLTSREIVWLKNGRLFKANGRHGLGYTIECIAPRRFLLSYGGNTLWLASNLDEAKRIAEMNYIQHSDTPGFDSYQL